MNAPHRADKLMNLNEARSIAGTLGFPSKMPGTSYGLPASKCVAGSKLSQVEGSVCNLCFALRDRYAWTNAQKAQNKRLQAISNSAWVQAITTLLINKHKSSRFKIDLGITGQRLQKRGGTRWRYNEAGFHRWHDSGDLQSVEHLAKICEVARRTPKIRHWLPTQELGMVRRYLATGQSVPSNLTIRVSSVMVDDAVRRSWPQTSSVFRDEAPSLSHACPAPEQEHRCGDCRACWSKDVAHVAYRLH